MTTTHVRRAFAKEILIDYFKMAIGAAKPQRWDPEHTANISAAVDALIDVAVEDAVQQMKEYQNALEEKP